MARSPGRSQLSRGNLERLGTKGARNVACEHARWEGPDADAHGNVPAAADVYAGRRVQLRWWRGLLPQPGARARRRPRRMKHAERTNAGCIGAVSRPAPIALLSSAARHSTVGLASRLAWHSSGLPEMTGGVLSSTGIVSRRRGRHVTLVPSRTSCASHVRSGRSRAASCGHYPGRARRVNVLLKLPLRRVRDSRCWPVFSVTVSSHRNGRGGSPSTRRCRPRRVSATLATVATRRCS